MTNENKVLFSETIISFGDYKGSDGCFKYGSVWGCDTGCPVLNAGKCELKDTDNKDLWEQVKSEQN